MMSTTTKDTNGKWDSRLGYFEVTDSVKYVKESEPKPFIDCYILQMVVVSFGIRNLRGPPTQSTSMPIILRDVSVYRQYF